MMAQSVKLPEETMAFVRAESARQSRSLAGQIAHWVRIGRAIERSGNFDYLRIAAALDASLPAEDLSDEEHDVWADTLMSELAAPTDEERSFFSERQRLGLGVGLSDGGEIVKAEPTA
ncbi:ParD-like family protein [Notoacmeibacter sp. MSK16QG-6]|uniref:ParD-like family protein n=1 Tax=Notoacmeibacter sp. MSK16QG-6 TaxID=2957982 RepID=UPI00209EE4B3|nr:ParD-like family protein [Notoacmeibacter sp. MSK16QG-6]MCP1199873.1 ParD-like family protein [Notoacmeibacter sp. MSK16QG-6]